MPCRPSPKSLRQSSLDAIAMNLELLCYGVRRGSKELSELIESSKFKEFSSPFKNLPASLLEDLNRTVYNKRSGLRHLLHPVVHPQLTSYTILLHGSIHVAMDLLANRCKKLRSLQMTYSVNLPPNYYSHFFAHFEHLISINLFGSMVDDDAFVVIGRCCAHLAELNAAQTWITDVGIRALSVNPDTGSLLCQKLQILNVSETRVSNDSLAFFLRTHPNARHIEHAETFQMFQEHTCQDQDGPDSRQVYHLRKLSSTKERLPPGVFRIALDVCSYVETLVLTAPGLRDNDLNLLKALPHLTSLHLANAAGLLTFTEGVVPVLVSRGEYLTKLVLESFGGVDVAYVGDSCPSLSHLALSAANAMVPVLLQSGKRFRRLAILELWSGDVCPTVLRQLTVNSPLRYLLLQGVNAAEYSLLSSVWDDNPMLTLENVVFDQCHAITVSLPQASCLWRLLELPNHLRILRSWNCKGVSGPDKDKLKAAIKDSNLNLYFEWYPYHDAMQDDITHQWQEYQFPQ